MAKEKTLHSEYFEKMMEDGCVAKAFFKFYLPTEIKERLDFETIELDQLKTKYVDDDVSGYRIVDFVFKAKIANE